MAEMIERHGQLVDADWWEAQRTRVRRIIDDARRVLNDRTIDRRPGGAS